VQFNTTIQLPLFAQTEQLKLSSGVLHKDEVLDRAVDEGNREIVVVRALYKNREQIQRLYRHRHQQSHGNVSIEVKRELFHRP
jgi:hypothetical protein